MITNDFNLKDTNNNNNNIIDSSNKNSFVNDANNKFDNNTKFDEINDIDSACKKSYLSIINIFKKIISFLLWFDIYIEAQ